MPRLRLEFAKAGDMKYISHLDLVRLMERAARRARIPIAYSKGYNPHPRFFFASPLPVGISGDREYVDLVLERPMSPEALAGSLRLSLPEGVEIRRVKEVSRSGPALMARVNRALYSLKVPVANGEIGQRVAEAARVLTSPGASKGGKGVVDRVEVRGIRGGFLEIEMLVGVGMAGNVKPAELLEELRGLGIPVDVRRAEIRRLGLFVKEDGVLLTPWDIC